MKEVLMRWSSRAFVLSAIGLLGSLALAWHLRDVTPITVIGPVAIGGAHAVNWQERHQAAPQSQGSNQGHP